MKISARNVLKGTVTGIKEGAVSAIVTIDVGGGTCVDASVTIDSVKMLGLAVGKEAYAVIKASDVMVGTEHHER